MAQIFEGQVGKLSRGGDQHQTYELPLPCPWLHPCCSGVESGLQLTETLRILMKKSSDFTGYKSFSAYPHCLHLVCTIQIYWQWVCADTTGKVHHGSSIKYISCFFLFLNERSWPWWLYRTKRRECLPGPWLPVLSWTGQCCLLTTFFETNFKSYSSATPQALVAR